MTTEFKVFLCILILLPIVALTLVLFIPTLGHSWHWLNSIIDRLVDWSE